MKMVKFDEGASCTESLVPVSINRTWIKTRCATIYIFVTIIGILLLVSCLMKNHAVETGEASRRSLKWEIYLPSTNSQLGYSPTNGSIGDQWIRKVYSNVPKDSKCTRVERMGSTGDGGKLVCVDHIISNAILQL